MNEFLLIFRNDMNTMQERRSPEQMQNTMTAWQDWIGGLGAQNKLVDRGNRLENDGTVVKPGAATNGPYVEVKEGIGGYTIIRADSLEEATKLCDGCPILSVGGSVEVRQISPM